MRQIFGDGFEAVVEEAVDDGLSRALGYSAMKSVTFYVASQLAIYDPQGYSRSLERIFGSGAQLLIDAISRSVCNATGLDVRAGESLSRVIESARQKFLTSGTLLRP